MLVLNLIIHHRLNTSYNRAQYKFPVPVQLMEVLKLFAVKWTLKCIFVPQTSTVLRTSSFTIIRHTSHDLTVMRVETSVEKTPYYILQ
jgi:hypothetical protein